jgi:transposase
MVVAPSLIPVRPGDKVKTDRRDALKLARLLRSGDLTSVWVPDREHEALRNLVRARADAKVDQLRAKHRLSKFLLRLGIEPPVGTRNWSERYFQWLRKVDFEHLADRVVFADYLAEVTAAGERIKRLEAALRQCAESSDQVALIRALQAFRGIGFVSAVSIVADHLPSGYTVARRTEKLSTQAVQPRARLPRTLAAARLCLTGPRFTIRCRWQITWSNQARLGMTLAWAGVAPNAPS